MGISYNRSRETDTYSTTIVASVSNKMSSDWSINSWRICPSEKPDGKCDFKESGSVLVNGLGNAGEWLTDERIQAAKSVRAARSEFFSILPPR